MTINELLMAIEAEPARSAWARGVKVYAKEMAERYPDMLNGAKSWKQYSWSGRSLDENLHIASRLCNDSEFQKCRAGKLRLNSREEWLDVQARALRQAAQMVRRLARA